LDGRRSREGERNADGGAGGGGALRGGGTPRSTNPNKRRGTKRERKLTENVFPKGKSMRPQNLIQLNKDLRGRGIEEGRDEEEESRGVNPYVIKEERYSHKNVFVGEDGGSERRNFGGEFEGRESIGPGTRSHEAYRKLWGCTMEKN